MFYHDTDPELGEVPNLEGCDHKEGVRDVKLGEDLSEDQQHMLKDLTRRYPDVFTDMTIESDVIQHRVKLTDDTPICCKPYPLPYAMREELQNEVDSMVKKKDGSNKVCIDFRKLSKITEVYPEPMMTAEDLFGRLTDMKYLSKINLTKGYWHIPVPPVYMFKQRL